MNSSPTHVREYIQEAYNKYINEWRNPFMRQAVPHIIQLADLIYSERKDKKNVDKNTILISSLTPENKIRTQELINKILPLINKMRKNLYGKEEPLFPYNIDNAIEWIKTTAKTEAFSFKRDIEKNKDRIFELQKEIYEKSKELSKLAHIEYSLKKEALPIIPIPLKIKGKYTGHSNLIWVWPGSRLAKLEGETKFLSWLTYLSQEALIMYVLTGIKPLPIRYKVTKEIKVGEYPGSKLNLELYQDLGNKGFLELSHTVRKFFKTKGKQLTLKHERIYNLVKRLGSVPKRGKMKFWEKFRLEWNKLYPDDEYNSSRGPRKAYLTIQKRLHSIK